MRQNERATFEKEKAVWETERQALYTHIYQLERSIESGGVAAGRPGAMPAMKTVMSGDHVLQRNGVNGGEVVGIRQTSLLERTTMTTRGGERVWEGASASLRHKPSRVFNDPPNFNSGLSSISESTVHGASSSATKATATNGGSGHKQDGNSAIINSGIDISLIRNDLDGITLKTSALPANVISRVVSGSATGSGSGSNPPAGSSSSESEGEEKFNRTKDAGHTPPPSATGTMEPLGGIGDEGAVEHDAMHNQHDTVHNNGRDEVSGIGNGSSATTPTQSRGNNSYIQPPPPSLAISAMESTSNIHLGGGSSRGAEGVVDPDPALIGPLSLPSEGETAPASTRFLKALDSKLMVEARKVVHRTPSEEEEGDGMSTTSTTSTFVAGVGEGSSSTTASASVSESATGTGPALTSNNPINNLIVPGTAYSGGHNGRQHLDGNTRHPNDRMSSNGNGDNSTNSHIHGGNFHGHRSMGDHRNEIEEDEIMPEPEIRLRFKRSMNFGSAFGSKRLGPTN